MRGLTRLVLVLMIGCVLGFSGCRNTSEELNIEAFKKKGNLVVLTDPTFPPYEYIGSNSSEVVGVDIEIANLVAKVLGVRLEVHQQTFARLLPSLKTNDGDIAMAGISLTPENQDAYPHSKPYAEACQRILVKKDRENIRGLDDLVGKKIGVPVGTTLATYIQKKLNNKEEPFREGTNTKIEQPDDTMGAIQALKNNHADAILLDDRTAAHYAGSDDGLKILPALLGEEEYVFVYAKNMSDEVIRLIDKVITDIRADGRLDAFYAKHDSVKPDEVIKSDKVGKKAIISDLWGSVRSAFVDGNARTLFFEGFKNTIILTCLSLFLGLAIGVLLAFIRAHHRFSGGLRFLNKCTICFVQIFRCTPLMLQILIFDFLLHRFGSYWITLIPAFGLNSGAYASEILRASIEEVDVGQHEAARLLGFSDNQALRLVIFPQAFKGSVPPLLNEFSALVKETSVASMIGFMTLVQSAKILNSTLFVVWPYFISGLLYFPIILFASGSLNWIKRWSNAREIRKEQTKYVRKNQGSK
ncbi:ABC transporter permease [Clostridia bacterium]|nr:ABC transporter permease [Clostridia bacterium]